MCKEVIDGEYVSRYVLSKRHFSSENRRVKYGAYLPAQNGECSVYRTSELSNDEIWEIGQKYVAIPTNRTLYAKAESTAKVIRNKGLNVVADTAPHPCHANIVDWPSERSEQKKLAIKISREAILAVHP